MPRLTVVTLCLLAVAAPLAVRAEDAAPSAADKAAAAAVRAAEAAEKAAEAAARIATAVEKIAVTPVKPAEAAPAAPAAAAAPAGPPPAVWTGVIGVGLISLTGNSQSLTFKASAALQRKSEEWIWGLKAGAVYGQQQVAGTNSSSVSALGASLQLRGDRRFNEMLSAYLIGGIDTDHIASLEERPYGEIGVSLIWFSTKEKIEGGKEFEKTSLRTDLGFRYGHEWRFQYYPPPVGVSSSLPGVDIIAPHAAAAYRYALNKDIIFTQDLDAVPNLVNEARLLLTSMSKLSSRLTSTVSLGVSFGIAYDSAPATGRKNVDTALTVGLDVAL